VTRFNTAIERARWVGKWVELRKEIAPRSTRVALLFNPGMATYAEYYLHPFKVAAAPLGVSIGRTCSRQSELDSVCYSQARKPNSGLIIMPDASSSAMARRLTFVGSRYRSLPSPPYWSRFYAEFGGLISMVLMAFDEYRRAASLC